MNAADLPGLQIRSLLVAPEAPNFRPPTWPPSGDYPVVIDAYGNVVSRYQDTRWTLGPWAGKPLSVSFGDGPTKGASVSHENAELFRQVTAWWLWGPGGVQEASTLKGRHDRLKRLFAVCSRAGILASDLSRFPRVIEELAARLPPSSASAGFGELYDLWAARTNLGFVLLDEAGIRLLARLLPDHSAAQTAYIPPRIWTYQLTRLRECLDDYQVHRQQVEDCYRFCLDAYARNAGGSLSLAFKGLTQQQLPFRKSNSIMRSAECRVFHGPFQLTAERFGINQLLDRWVKNDYGGIRAFSSYLSLISQAGLAYILNFSLMRIDEGCQLRSNCFSVERDPLGEDIHLLGGITSKTIKDGDACWIVSSSVKVAVDAMTSVANLRMEAAVHNPNLHLSSEEIRNPLLQVWSHEPWSANVVGKGRRQELRYARVLECWPKLFDKAELRITKEDLAIANRVTLGLDPERFSVGKVWPLSWHQLRRTGAVNMLSTGYVSDASLQYQLKHASRAMTRYYGQNYYHLKAHIDDETRGFYLKNMYQAVVNEFVALQSERFVSPHGTMRKDQILVEIAEKDHKTLLGDAKAGRVRYQETFLGGCANPGPPCPLGGISNISGCMGGGRVAPCEWVLLDRKKQPIVERLRGVLLDRLQVAEPGSRLHESLRVQIESAERALNVLNTV